MKPRFGRFVSIIHRLSHSYVYEEMGPGKIGCGEFGALMHLSRMSSKPSQEELRKALEIDKGALARTIASLEDKGFLIRSKDRDDRRIRRLELTEKGKDTADLVRKTMDRWVSSITEDIDKADLEITVTTLKKMAEKAIIVRDEERSRRIT